MVNIFYSSFDEKNYSRYSIYNKLSDSYFSKISNKKKLMESYFSYSFLFYILKEKYQDSPTLKIDNINKPTLVNSLYKINISHSYNFAAVAIGDREVGLDIEYSRIIPKYKLNLLSNRLFGHELSSSEFLRIWTIKESYVKLLGIGLIYNLIDIEIDEANSTIKYKDYPIAYYYSELRNNIYFAISTYDNNEIKFNKIED